MNSRDVPDDVRQTAAQQLQDLMQGKKPGGKGGGQLSPVLQNLLKMIGKSHGDQGQQKPGENLPNGQAAPGTAGSQPGLPAPPPTNTNPQTGRPSLQGTGNAATDPANSPVPAASPTPGAQGGSTLDQQIAKTQDALQRTTNPYTKSRLQERLDTLMDSKAKNEAAEGLEEKRETGREALERAKADAAKALQDLKDKSAKDIADAKLQGAKEEKEARAKADRDLEDQKEKNREALKKVIPGKAAGSGASTSKATERRLEHVEDEKAADLKKAEAKYTSEMDAAGKLGGTQKKEAAARAKETLLKAKAQAQTDYVNKIKQATKGGGGDDERVPILDPNGKPGTVPRSQLLRSSPARLHGADWARRRLNAADRLSAA